MILIVLDKYLFLCLRRMLIHGLFHTHGMKNHQASEGVEYDINNLIIEPPRGTFRIVKLLT